MDAQVTTVRNDKTRLRDMSRVKLLKTRPEHLRREKPQISKNYCDSVDNFVDIKKLAPIPEHRQESGEPDLEQEELPTAEEEEQQQEKHQTPARRIRKQRVIYPHGFSKQPSPQQRKKS